MNPKGFGKLDNHKQEQWKTPLPQFIEHLYMKRFGKEAPDSVLSFKEITKLKIQKKVATKERKVVRRTTAALSETLFFCEIRTSAGCPIAMENGESA